MAECMDCLKSEDCEQCHNCDYFDSGVDSEPCNTCLSTEPETTCQHSLLTV